MYNVACEYEHTDINETDLSPPDALNKRFRSGTHRRGTLFCLCFFGLLPFKNNIHMLHHMLIHIGGWTGHRAEIVIAGTDPQNRRKKICKVHQEVADEDAFNGLEFGQDLLLNEAFKLVAMHMHLHNF